MYLGQKMELHMWTYNSLRLAEFRLHFERLASTKPCIKLVASSHSAAVTEFIFQGLIPVDVLV